MTAQDIFERYILTLMGESSETAEDYAEFLLNAINIILLDLFELNNAIRQAKGKDSIEGFEALKSKTEVISYEEELLIGVLPYGAATILVLDDDKQKAGYFDYVYQNKKQEHVPAKWVTV